MILMLIMLFGEEQLTKAFWKIYQIKEKISLEMQKTEMKHLMIKNHWLMISDNKFQMTMEQDLKNVDIIHEDLIEADNTRAAEVEIKVEKGKHIINNF